MTKFEELMNITKKNKEKKIDDDKKETDGLEVSGLTDSGNGQPNIGFASDEQDMPLTDQIYRGKHKPSMGEGAYWTND
jgi:hypothetical protein